MPLGVLSGAVIPLLVQPTLTLRSRRSRVRRLALAHTWRAQHAPAQEVLQ